MAIALVTLLAGCRDDPVAPRRVACTTEGATDIVLAVGGVHVLTDPADMACVSLTATSATTEYLLVPANANDVRDVVGSFSVESESDVVTVAAAVGTESQSADVSSAETRAMLSDAADMTLAWEDAEAAAPSGTELRLRRAEQELVRRWGVPSAQPAPAPAGPTSSDPSGPELAFSTTLPAAPVVGDTLRLRVPDAREGKNPCRDYFTVKAIVRTVGQYGIVLEDSAAPSGAFTSTDFQNIAQEFDTHIYPTDTAYFGGPTDLDANARVLILYTPRVNELTPRNSTSFVAGFFFGGDLFPTTSCPQSNQAEIFYLLSPDPDGQFGDKRRTDMVRQLTRGTTAHELQHMINQGVRMRIGAPAFETVWLNEALSHLAEELVGRRERGLGEMQNLMFSDLVRTAGDTLDFKAFFHQNLARYYTWLVRPDTASPTSRHTDRQIAYRGAAWALLRYTADHYAASDDVAAFTRRLVATRDTSVVNLTRVAGAPFATILSGWLVAAYADELGIAGLQRAYTFRSWHMRDVESRYSPTRTYPLAVAQLTGSVSVTSQARSGTGRFYRGTLAAGSQPLMFRLLDPEGGPVRFTGARLMVLRIR